MHTDELITLLATGAGPAPRAPAARRLLPAITLGLLLSATGALVLVGPIPAALYADPGPWLKLAYGGGLAGVGAWLVARLGRPLPRIAGPTGALALVVGAMLLLGLADLLLTPAEARLATLLGHSWSYCPLYVLGLSLPGLAGALWALRGLAPTRPRAAGFAAGLLAGALGAVGYALSCTELAPAFVAVWYSLGIALAGGLGALLGPALLRW